MQNNDPTIIPCPCNSGKPYSHCCEPYICGKEIPATPEALMRSRYTAYSQANVEYIAATMLDKALLDFDAEKVREWAKQVEWLGLKVFGSKISSQDSNIGYVEFRVSYRSNGKKGYIHEKSEFRYQNGRWFYVDGVEK